MIIRYNYICSACNHNYIEQRYDSENQFFTICHKCNNGNYSESSRLEMYTFAVMEGNSVSSFYVADAADTATYLTKKECIKFPEDNPASTAFTYDRKHKVFVPNGSYYDPITETFKPIESETL